MIEAPTPSILPAIKVPPPIPKNANDKSVKELARELKVILRDNRVRRAV